MKRSDGTICFLHFDSNRTNIRINKHIVIVLNDARRGTAKLLLVSLLRKLKRIYLMNKDTMFSVVSYASYTIHVLNLKLLPFAIHLNFEDIKFYHTGI